ncbi:MAG: polysaccharide biosynthesis protein [Acidobacteria bacterium]|nr:polysaccharide biosynthesis protein [Acidobacteriota bacterium]
MLGKIGSNWAAIAASVVVAYILTPFSIRVLGDSGYGTWLLISSIAGYLQLLTLGAPMASVRYVAKYAAEKDQSGLDTTVGTFYVMYLTMVLLTLTSGLVLFFVFQRVWTVPAEIVQASQWAFGLFVLYVALIMVQQFPNGILSAYQDFVAINLVAISGFALKLGLTISLLTWKASVIVLSAVPAGVTPLEVTALWILVRRRHPEIHFRMCDFRIYMLKRVLSFSAYVLVLNLGAQLAFKTNAMVIGAFLGVDSVPFFAVANSLVLYLTEFIIGIAAVVMPTTTALHSKGDLDQLRNFYLRWSKIAYSLTLLAGVYLLVAGPDFIGWWINLSYRRPSGNVLIVLMLSFLIFLPIRGVAQPMLMGIGKPRLPTIMFIGAAVLNLALSIALAPRLGLIGVAVGAALPNVLYAIGVLVVACREVDLSISHFIRYTFFRTTAGAILAAIMLYWFSRAIDMHRFWGLAAAGVGLLIVFTGIWLAYVYHDDPYVDLGASLRQVWERS